MKSKSETTRKVNIEDVQFIEKFISDRHSKEIDKKRISQARAWNFVTKYIKLDKQLYDRLVHIPITEKKNV